jgi:hypothetical protein
MYWAWLIVVVIAIIVAIVLLNRFYRKASREVALIRTGLGGQRIITDGHPVGEIPHCRCVLRKQYGQHHFFHEQLLPGPWRKPYWIPGAAGMRL